MGTIVQLSVAPGRASAQRPSKTLPASDRAEGRAALVLGGGGITGAAYHLGVLNAVNAMSSSFSVTDFDIYVGTSAGAVVAACLANGIEPEDLLRANLGHPCESIPPIGADDVMSPDRRGLLRSVVRWPLGIFGTLARYAGHPFTTRLIDGLGALAEGLPPALYTTDGTERYLRRLLDAPGRANGFGQTRGDLYITATDLDTAQRIVLGEDATSDVTISEASAASTAIPLLYAPRRIGDRVCIDGGLTSTTNLDIAIAHGATLIVCINPLVPYVHDSSRLLPSSAGLPSRHLSQKGFPHIAAQSFRIMAQAQLEKEMELVAHAHPDVDIVLIEPRSDDEHLFVFNLMDYGSRERIARHAFESVAVDLVTRYPDYSRVLSSHGIDLDRDSLIEQLREIVDGTEPRFLGNGASSDRTRSAAKVS